MSKEIATIDYSKKEVIETLKATIAKGATDADLSLFLEHCKATGLNPFKKEVWFIKGKGYTKKDGEEVEGTLQIMTGINGFQAVANSHPQYDGTEVIESDNKITIDKATFEDWKGNITEKKVSPPIIAPEYIDVKVWRKDRKFPATARARWSEYGKDVLSPKGKRTIWGQMPSIMLAKCAKSLALREAFPQELNGVYTTDEMPPEYSVVEVVKEESAKNNKKPDVSQAQILDKKELIEPLNEVAQQVFGDDNISLTTAESYVYNLAPKFKDVDAKKYNERFDWCKSQGGKPLGNHVWAFVHAVKALAEHQIESDELVEQGRAA